MSILELEFLRFRSFIDGRSRQARVRDWGHVVEDGVCEESVGLGRALRRWGGNEEFKPSEREKREIRDFQTWIGESFDGFLFGEEVWLGGD